MNLRTSVGFRLISIAAVINLAAIFLLALPFLRVDIENTDLKIIDVSEVTWEDAMSRCGSEVNEGTLPSIYQLIAIYYQRSDIELIKDTDYWSRNSFAGYAFGLNTGLGIPSFDKHADTDHFLCIDKR